MAAIIGGLASAFLPKIINWGINKVSNLIGGDAIGKIKTFATNVIENPIVQTVAEEIQTQLNAPKGTNPNLPIGPEGFTAPYNPPLTPEITQEAANEDYQ